jgi:hypothetical protein
MYVCMYDGARKDVDMYVCVYVCMCVYVSMNLCMYDGACKDVDMYACVYVCMCVCVYVSMNLCVYVRDEVAYAHTSIIDTGTYIHAYMHTYMHAYMHTCIVYNRYRYTCLIHVCMSEMKLHMHIRLYL